jgi:hypothetical protein
MLNKKKLIFVIFLLMSIEFSGDSIIRAFPFDAQLIGNIYQIIVGGLVLVAIVAFDIRIPNNINLSLPFWMILLILIAAFIHGALLPLTYLHDH